MGSPSQSHNGRSPLPYQRSRIPASGITPAIALSLRPGDATPAARRPDTRPSSQDERGDSAARRSLLHECGRRLGPARRRRIADCVCDRRQRRRAARPRPASFWLTAQNASRDSAEASDEDLDAHAGSRWKTAPVSSSRPVCAACFAHAFAARGGGVGRRCRRGGAQSTEPWVLTMTSRGLSAAGRRADRSARRRRATIRRMRVLPSGVLRFSRGSPVRRRAARCGGRGARRRRRCRVAGGVRAAPRR